MSQMTLNINAKFKIKKLMFKIQQILLKKMHKHTLNNHETETRTGLFFSESVFHGFAIYIAHNFNL